MKSLITLSSENEITILFVTFYAQLAQIFSPSHERNSVIISFSVKASLIKDIDIALR